MPIRVTINGFGRIGRTAFKFALKNKKLQVVAINDLADPETMAALLQRDTVYGIYQEKISYDKKNIIIKGKRYLVLAEKDPTKLPWKKLKIDVVLECTGRFVENGAAYAHIKAGAKKVIISAPDKGKSDIKTFLIGVNEKGYSGEQVISMGSCTTNCVAPITQIIEKSFGIKKAMLTTVHSYTAEQNLVDGPLPPLHKDLRRARAAAQNIVPTSTGAAVAVTKVMPELKNKFDGLALRVPTICGSITDFTFLVKKNVTDKKVNNALIRAAKSPQYQNILAVSNEPLVSSDIIGTTASAIVDLSLTKVMAGNLVKVMAWYDNEWAYSCRLAEMAVVVGK